MILEVELVESFKQKGLKLRHSTPRDRVYPFVLFDRLSSRLQLAPGYVEANFAFDVVGGDLEQVLSQVSSIELLFEEKLETDDRFTAAEIYNLIDNSSEPDEIVYTLYVRFVYNKAS